MSMSLLLRYKPILQCSNFFHQALVSQKHLSLVFPTTYELVKGNFVENIAKLWDGLLWAAPKNRRSLQKRKWLRKFRALKPRNDIEDCILCGHKKLMGKLCQNCFQYTMKLTEETWKKLKEEGKCRRDRYVR